MSRINFYPIRKGEHTLFVSPRRRHGYERFPTKCLWLYMKGCMPHQNINSCGIAVVQFGVDTVSIIHLARCHRDKFDQRWQTWFGFPLENSHGRCWKMSDFTRFTQDEVSSKEHTCQSGTNPMQYAWAIVPCRWIILKSPFANCESY